MASQVVQGPVTREEEEETAADGGFMVVGSASEDVEIGKGRGNDPSTFSKEVTIFIPPDFPGASRRRRGKQAF